MILNFLFSIGSTNLGENYKANFVEIHQYQQKLQKQRTNSIFIGENYNANFVDIRQNRPPSTIYKNSKNIERTLFWSAKIKTRTLSENVKIDPQEYVYQGSPPSTIKKNPQEYVYQGFSHPLLSTKTPKT